jgi:hypothetical protein
VRSQPLAHRARKGWATPTPTPAQDYSGGGGFAQSAPAPCKVRKERATPLCCFSWGVGVSDSTGASLHEVPAALRVTERGWATLLRGSCGSCDPTPCAQDAQGMGYPRRSYRFVCRVTKVAIDRRARGSENKRHGEIVAGAMPASGWLRGEEAAGRGDTRSDSEPVATGDSRSHRTLCRGQAGKCQYGDVQLSARDHCDRFKNRAHQASLQENERGEMRPWRGRALC